MFTDSSKTSVKDMMTLLDEVNTKWDTLTDVQKKGLSEGLAGKTQAAVFQSLMSGWKRVKQFQEEYNEGSMVGSAEKENLKYLDSIQGKWNQLKETMKGLVTNNVSQSFIKGMLDGATELVGVIDKITTSLGKLGSLGAMAGIVSFIKSMSNFSNLPTSLNFDTGVFKSIKDVFALTSQGFKMDGMIGGFKSLGVGLQSLVSGAGLAKIALAGLKAIFVSFGVGLAIAGITALVKKLYDLDHATENAVKSAKEMQNSARDEITSLNQQKKGLAEIAKEYDELNKKTNKTAEEYDRFKELKHQVANLAPDLVMG